MSNPKELLISTLTDNFKTYPVYLQGSLSNDDVYPDSFFTYWNNDTLDVSFFDNEPSVVIWDFDLNFYSLDPDLVNTVLLTAKTLLKQAGFIPDGSGHDVASDEDTHTGRGIGLMYMQKLIEVENTTTTTSEEQTEQQNTESEE